jgi:hypothetical protein
MVEQAAVNRKVVGSSPTSGATFLYTETDGANVRLASEYSNRYCNRYRNGPGSRPRCEPS